ncbi:hypothetical protein WMY93_030017 [Mugilogobius chulae]|uniref:Ig-like domain-containing protein n=1 Tax=Mugilogobius chulae TaxID=88201 RepID=A0AAW0MYL6_9GOBI
MVLKTPQLWSVRRFTVSRSVSDTELLQQSQASCPTLHLVQTQLTGASQNRDRGGDYNMLSVTPCPLTPPKLTWDLHQDTVNITERNSDGTFTTKITQNITLTDAHDGLMIKCNASYPVSGGGFKMSDSNVTLNVSYGPKNTSAVVSPSGSLSAGQSVTLSCSSRAKPPVQHFTWFRHSSQGPVNVTEGQTYTFNFTEDEQYYCVVLNALGLQFSPVIQLRKNGCFLLYVSLGAVFGLLFVVCLVLFALRLRAKCRAPEDEEEEESYVNFWFIKMKLRTKDEVQPQIKEKIRKSVKVNFSQI